MIQVVLNNATVENRPLESSLLVMQSLTFLILVFRPFPHMGTRTPQSTAQSQGLSQDAIDILTQMAQ
ncbi:unnamed protein product [Rhodiola kirilowii]